MNRPTIVYNGEHITQDGNERPLRQISQAEAIRLVRALKDGEALVLNAERKQQSW
jgi:hypothetical protein